MSLSLLWGECREGSLPQVFQNQIRSQANYSKQKIEQNAILIRRKSAVCFGGVCVCGVCVCVCSPKQQCNEKCISHQDSAQKICRHYMDLFHMLFNRPGEMLSPISFKKSPVLPDHLVCFYPWTLKPKANGIYAFPLACGKFRAKFPGNFQQLPRNCIFSAKTLPLILFT